MTARLYFLHTVPPSILSSSAPVSKVINSSASLFCLFRGYPLPTISWLKDGLPVAADSSITITTQSAISVSPGYLQQLNTTFTGDVGVISVLQFSSLQRKDNGMYVCQAMNTFKKLLFFHECCYVIVCLCRGAISSWSIFNQLHSCVSLPIMEFSFLYGNSAVLGYKVYQRAVDSERSPTQLGLASTLPLPP